MLPRVIWLRHAGLIVVGMGSKLIKSAIYVTPEENAHPKHFLNSIFEKKYR